MPFSLQKGPVRADWAGGASLGQATLIGESAAQSDGGRLEDIDALLGAADPSSGLQADCDDAGFFAPAVKR